MTKNERKFTIAYLSYTITGLHMKSISKVYEFHKNLFDLTKVEIPCNITENAFWKTFSMTLSNKAEDG